jgi:hypothetical protein
MSADIWLEDEQGRELDFGEEDAPLIRAPSSVGNNHFNLTYNLSPMLKAAGMPAWRELIGMPTPAAEAIWMIVVDALIADPVRFKAMNPANGWGSYNDAVRVLSELVAACHAYPEAKIGGWL